MLWIDRVRSVRHQTRNTPAGAIPKTAVVTARGTPRLLVRLSLTRVPTTLISTTTSQYTTGT
jgi:hypothetical protein